MTMADITIIDAATGEVTHRDFTPEEVAQRVADQAEHAIRSAAEAVVTGNRGTITGRASQALADNRAFLAKATFSNAEVLAQVKDLSRQNNAIIRLLLNTLDGTD